MNRLAISERMQGNVFTSLAYVLWGVIPLYFLLLVPMSAGEIVGWRVLFSLVFCALLVSVTRGWARIAAALRDRKVMLLSALAGVIIYINWFLFTLAATTGFVLETSLGYFITPIVTVVLGVVLLGERLRPLQWLAFLLVAIAVVFIAVMYGRIPWLALALAVSFGFYGYVKKRIGPSVDAVTGLTLETAWVVPLAIVQLVFVFARGESQLDVFTTGQFWALPLSGLVTALPLLLFAAGVRRVRLLTLGMLQFIEPTLQFMTGTFLLGEPMPIERLIGFAIVWASVIVLIVDALIAARVRKRGNIEPIPTLHTGPLPIIDPEKGRS